MEHGAEIVNRYLVNKMRVEHKKNTLPAAPETVSYLSFSAGILVALLILVLAGPELRWLDTGEFVASSFELGIAHPPGHPLPSLFGKLCSFIPLGSVAFRVNLASGLALAFAAALGVKFIWEILDVTVRTWFVDISPLDGNIVTHLPSFAAVLIFGVTGSALLQGVRAEVYAMNLALCLAGCLGLVRWWKTGNKGPLWAGGVGFGLAMTNHHLLALAVAIPATVFVLIIAFKRNPAHPARVFSVWLCSIASGLAVLSYLPLRAQAEPLVNWGRPDTLGRAFWTFSAQIFSSTAIESVARGFSDRFLVFMGQVVFDLGWVVLFLAVLGMYLFMRKRNTVAFGGLIFVWFTTSVLACLVGSFSPANPDSLGYMLTFLFLTVAVSSIPPALLGATAIQASRGKKGFEKKMRAGVLIALSFLLVGVPFTLNRGMDAVNDSNSWSRFELNELTFANLPPSALFLAGYHETVFGLWYGIVVCGKRPDVAVVYRQNVNIPGRLKQLEKRWPDIAFVLKKLNKRGAADRELLKVARFRPVIVEPDNSPADPLGAIVLDRLQPQGLWFKLDSQVSDVQMEAENREAWRRVLETSEVFLHEEGVKRFLLWRSYQSIWLLEKQQRCSLAEPAIRIARSIAPLDPMLKPLLESCGP